MIRAIHSGFNFYPVDNNYKSVAPHDKDLKTQIAIPVAKSNLYSKFLAFLGIRAKLQGPDTAY
jgi:hypothetical protein